MRSWLSKYRAHLTRVAATEGSSAFNRVSFPWMLPIVAAVPICYGFDLSGTDSFWVVIPTGAVSFAGIVYVAYVLMREGPIANFKKYRASRGDRNGS
jgi:hypothetical protein